MATNNPKICHAAEFELDDNKLDTLLEWFDTVRECESNGADATHAMAHQVGAMMKASRSLDPDSRSAHARRVRLRLLMAAALMDAAAKTLKTAQRETISAFTETGPSRNQIGLER